ncbi:MAG: Sarcosine oxidase subunit alpha [Alphaproteobacteria bacterium MarineAlpha2_Bin1]|nr:MAG: Sarcosine oxidase subunit alpha [Alphaproteobacteria bacterium MarineAlpha2_Bin1]
MRINSSDLIDRSKVIKFYFNGKTYKAFEGDTIASALISNGIFFTSRSIKYHRPRGVYSHSFEEPNTLFELNSDDMYEPNVLSTRQNIYEGMKIKTINSWPSLNLDFFSFLILLSNFLKAGFYYKTFFGSNYLWKNFFEPFLRKMSGFSIAPNKSDKSNYTKKNIKCDILIIGCGPSGIAAASSLCKSNLDILLIEDDSKPGVRLNDSKERDWFNNTIKELGNRVRIYTNTTVFGAYTNNYFTAVERINKKIKGLIFKERLLLIRAKKVILANGSIERPIVFPNNDRPGIFLSNSSTYYLNKFGILLGKKIILFTNNDYAYSDILNLKNNGAEIIAIVDVRQNLNGHLPEIARDKGISIYKGFFISDTYGRKKIKSIKINSLVNKKMYNLKCDCLLVSGGFSPSIHLHSQQGGDITYNNDICSFIPRNFLSNQICVGSLVGNASFIDCIKSGIEAGNSILREFGLKEYLKSNLTEFDTISYDKIEPFWCVETSKKLESKSFVDLQNDTTIADIKLANIEGFKNPEHVKRYTLNGFGTDQGKTSGIISLGIISQILNKPIEKLRPTTFRSPFIPITFGVLAGRQIKELLDPVRRTALHQCHINLGAEFEDVGQWKRPWFYPKLKEDINQAVSRECLNVRSGVGMLDASTLGKIEISGKDASIFLNKVYTNNFFNMNVGKIKYGLLLKEDGMVFDDGTTTRLSENKYLMTTTTSNAALVLDWLEEWLQTEWVNLDVFLTSVTDHWAVITVSGPKSRDVISKLDPSISLDSNDFPFMTYKEANLAGIDCRIFRISFTGELSYEINIPWPHATYIWNKLFDVGADYNITPYGTESMHVLRAEKGYPIIGQDTDGTINPYELGMHVLLSKKKDFLGKRSLSREFKSDKYFVGFKTVDPNIVIPEGAQIISLDKIVNNDKEELESLLINGVLDSKGYVTSSYFSPILNHSIALGFLKNGKDKINTDEIFYATADNNKLIRTKIVSSVFYDDKGLRKDG